MFSRTVCDAQYGPPTLGRRSPLTLAEAAVAASRRRPSYLDDSGAGLDLPVELRSQLHGAHQLLLLSVSSTIALFSLVTDVLLRTTWKTDACWGVHPAL